MNPVDQFFNLAERCEHALVNLHPDFALMLIEQGIMAAFLHTVYCSNDFYAQVLLPYRQIPSSRCGRHAANSVHVLRVLTARQKILVRHPGDRRDRHHHGILVDELH